MDTKKSKSIKRNCVCSWHDFCFSDRAVWKWEVRYLVEPAGGWQGRGTRSSSQARSAVLTRTPEELPGSSLSHFMSTQLRQPVAPNAAQPFVTVPCKWSQPAKIRATCGSHALCYQPDSESKGTVSGDWAVLERGLCWKCHWLVWVTFHFKPARFSIFGSVRHFYLNVLGILELWWSMTNVLHLSRVFEDLYFSWVLFCWELCYICNINISTLLQYSKCQGQNWKKKTMTIWQ